VKSNEISSV